jgi:cytochrome c peroxidase
LVPLGPKPELTPVRKGEMHFHDAWLCFQHWQSCASCHPDARVDGLNWDLMNDGLGNPKNTRSMLYSHLTQPLMAAGVRPDVRAAVEAGFVHIQFAVRPKEDIDAVVQYIEALRPVPSPFLVNGDLSEKARRGRELFFSDRLRCHLCHPEGLYTDSRLHNVGSRGQYDDRDEFTSPTLVECWRTAPYMHDGHYTDLYQLFREGRHGATHGAVGELSDEELEALVEFLLSL